MSSGRLYSKLTRKQQLIIKSHVKDFLVDLQTGIFTKSADEIDDMNTVKNYFEMLHEEHVCKHIEDHIYPHRKRVRGKDLAFFLNDKSLFAGLPEKKLAYYSREITNDRRISVEDRESIWEYIIVMIDLLEQK